MDFKRWICAGTLLLSAGALANCSRIFEPSDAKREGTTPAALVETQAGTGGFAQQ